MIDRFVDDASARAAELQAAGVATIESPQTFALTTGPNFARAHDLLPETRIGFGLATARPAHELPEHESRPPTKNSFGP